MITLPTIGLGGKSLSLVGTGIPSPASATPTPAPTPSKFFGSTSTTWGSSAPAFGATS